MALARLTDNELRELILEHSIIGGSYTATQMYDLLLAERVIRGSTPNNVRSALIRLEREGHFMQTPKRKPITWKRIRRISTAHNRPSGPNAGQHPMVIKSASKYD